MAAFAFGFMRNILTITCFLAFFIYGQAQEMFQREKRDYIWLVGSSPLEGGWADVTQLDFRTEPPTISGYDLDMNFGGLTPISVAPTAALWTYTNGMELRNYLNDTFKYWPINLVNIQDILVMKVIQPSKELYFLPKPGSDSIVYLFP